MLMSLHSTGKYVHWSDIEYVIDITRSLASNEAAWSCVRKYPGINRNTNFNDLLSWGLAATKFATSRLHIDDQGFTTMIQILAGSKYWVVARPTTDLMRSTNLVDIWDSPNNNLDLEGVLLEPSSVL